MKNGETVLSILDSENSLKIEVQWIVDKAIKWKWAIFKGILAEEGSKVRGSHQCQLQRILKNNSKQFI